MDLTRPGSESIIVILRKKNCNLTIWRELNNVMKYVKHFKVETIALINTLWRVKYDV